MLAVLVGIWFFVFCVWYWLGRRRLIYYASRIPGPPGYPIIGNILTLWGKPEDVFKRLHKLSYEYTRMVGLWIGPKLHVVLLDAKDIEVVLKSRAIEKSDEYQILKPWLGDSLLLSKGSKFRLSKKLIMPSFHVNNIKLYLPVFNDHAVSLNERLQMELGKEEFNMGPYLSKTTMDILLETMLGLSKDTLGKDALNYANAVEMLGRLSHIRMYKFWLRPDIIFRFSNTCKQQRKYLGIVHTLTDRVIQQRKKKYECQKEENVIEENGGRTHSKIFLDSLLEAKDEDGVGFTDEDIKAEVMTMMFAGQDTTSATLGFVLSLLGIFHRVQDKVIMELDEIFGDSSRPVTYEDIQNLRYMEQVVQETWRLYPPIPLIGRKSLDDIPLETCVIPANVTVAIGIIGLHRNPKYYTNPDRFNPDNFSPENIKARHPYSFLPFSGGTRSCIGPRYATLLVKVILATLLRSYKVFSKKREMEFVLAAQTVLKRRDGYLISLQPREKSARITAAA